MHIPLTEVNLLLSLGAKVEDINIITDLDVNLETDLDVNQHRVGFLIPDHV